MLDHESKMALSNCMDIIRALIQEASNTKGPAYCAGDHYQTMKWIWDQSKFASMFDWGSNEDDSMVIRLVCISPNAQVYGVEARIGYATDDRDLSTKELQAKDINNPYKWVRFEENKNA